MDILYFSNMVLELLQIIAHVVDHEPKLVLLLATNEVYTFFFKVSSKSLLYCYDISYALCPAPCAILTN
jgi:hypothetical protein